MVCIVKFKRKVHFCMFNAVSMSELYCCLSQNVLSDKLRKLLLELIPNP